MATDIIARGMAADAKTHFVAGANIVFQNKPDGTQSINASGSVSANDEVARTNIANHIADKNNPHEVDKSDVGLANCDNTSDANKPISTATQTALDLKTDSTDFTAHTSNVTNPHSVTAEQVGLGNVDNTADTDKPISTAVQTALDGKSNTTHLHDDRYYTEAEVDTLLSGKSDTTHNHDSRYYTETETNTLLAGKSNTTHTHTKSEITDFPTSMTANGGNSDTVNNLTVETAVPENAVFTDTIYSVATTTANGLMSSTDKVKLNGIAENANNYELPTASTSILGGVKVDGTTVGVTDGVLTANYIGENLLINPDFHVNQRGLTTYPSGGYTVDRWSVNGGEATVGTGGITSSGFISQNIENMNELVGKTLTFSAGLENGEIVSGTGVVNMDSDVWFYQSTTLPSLIYWYNGGTTEGFAILPKGNTVAWAKLELGSAATAFVPPNPADELARCQRYYQIRSTNDIAAVDLRPTMRVAPTDIAAVTGGYAYSAEL